MSASWPTSVATDSTLYVAVNELQNNLSGAINNSVTTIGLNSTTGFPTVGLVLIDNEVIKYGGISGNNLTSCTRAFDGTTAASHSSAAVVSFAFCAAHHNGLKDEVIAIETSLNLTASRALASDTNGRVAVSAVTGTELGRLSGVTSAIQTQLDAKIANPLTGDLAAGSHKVTGLAAATTNGDALRYEQLIGLYLLLTGGTLSGNLAMGSNKVTGLAAAAANGDAVRFEQNKVVQITTGTSTTNFSTSSASYVTTNLSATITPTSASNKIMVFAFATIQSGVSNQENNYTLARGGSNILATPGQQSFFSVGQLECPFALGYLDSPASTSALTYAIQMKTSGGAASFGGSGFTQFMILVEVVA